MTGDPLTDAASALLLDSDLPLRLHGASDEDELSARLAEIGHPVDATVLRAAGTDGVALDLLPAGVLPVALRDGPDGLEVAWIDLRGIAEHVGFAERVELATGDPARAILRPRTPIGQLAQVGLRAAAADPRAIVVGSSPAGTASVVAALRTVEGLVTHAHPAILGEVLELSDIDAGEHLALVSAALLALGQAEALGSPAAAMVVAVDHVSEASLGVLREASPTTAIIGLIEDPAAAVEAWGAGSEAHAAEEVAATLRALLADAQAHGTLIVDRADLAGGGLEAIAASVGCVIGDLGDAPTADPPAGAAARAAADRWCAEPYAALRALAWRREDP